MAINSSKALDAQNGLRVTDDGTEGPFITGAPTSPVGLALPVDTIYFQNTASGILIWKKFGAGVNDWRQISAQDIPFVPVTNIVATNTQAAIETHVGRHNPNGPDAIATAIASTIGTDTVNTVGTASSVSRSDHTHEVNLPQSSAYASATTTTTSTTAVAMAAMTLTPGAGTYLVLFATSLLSSTNNAVQTVAVFANGTLVADTEITAIPRDTNSSSNRVPISTFGVATVADGQAIDIRWRTTAGTATAYNRKLQLVRIA